MLGLDVFAKMIPADAFQRMTEFVNAWTGFMNRVGQHMNAVLARLDAIDNKLSISIMMTSGVDEKLTILMSETRITPEIHEVALTMAQSDPRNDPRLFTMSREEFDATYNRSNLIGGPN